MLKDHFHNLIEDNVVLRLVREFVLIPVADGVLVDGGRNAELLTGPSAISLLPILLPYLMGTHTLLDIQEALPHVPHPELADLLERLLAWRVLTHEAEPSSRCVLARNTLSALKRWDIGVDERRLESLLKSYDISVVFEPSFGELAEKLMNVLRDNGWKYVDLQSSDRFPAKGPTENKFAVSLSKGGNNQDTMLHYRKLNDSGIPWLRTVLDMDSQLAEVGPIFYPDTTLCTICLAQTIDTISQGDLLTSTTWDIWAALLGSEITLQLMQICSTGPCTVHCYRLPLLERTLRTWREAKVCPHIDVSATPPLNAQYAVKDLLPFYYEQAIARRHESADMTSQQPSLAMAAETKKLLNSAVVQLPEVRPAFASDVLELLTRKPKLNTDYLDAARIAALLKYTCGLKHISNEMVRRWAPSAGNLGSVEAYLVARDIEGLEQGVYLYQPLDHTLALLNQRRASHIEQAFAATECLEESRGLIVMVGAYRRIAAKYHGFGYKLVYLDAGVASSQLLTVANALDLHVSSVTGWNVRKIEKALSLRTLHEIPTQVFRLGDAHSHRLKTEASVLPVENLSVSDLELSDTYQADKIVDRMIVGESDVRERLPFSISVKGGPVNRRRLSGFLYTPTDRMFKQILDKRRSVREFSSKPVEEKIIRRVLEITFADNVATETPLGISVLVKNAKGLSAGVYSYNPKSRMLAPRFRELSREQMRRARPKPQYEDTPVVFWISGDVRGGIWSGKLNYQTALVRAGYLSHRFYLASMGLGLSGVLIAGISSETGTKKDEWTSSQETGLIAYLCGYPKTI